MCRLSFSKMLRWVSRHFFIWRSDVDKEGSIAYHLRSDRVSLRRNYGKSDI